MASLEDKRVAFISRCSWTLYNFRRNLILSTKSKGADVKAFGAGGDGFAERLEDLGLPFQPVSLQKRGLNPFSDIGFFLKLFFLFRRSNFDIAHFFTIKPVIYGLIAGKLAGVPVRIATITGLGHAFYREGGCLNRLVCLLYKVSLSACDQVIFQNRDDMALFIKRQLLPETKCSLVPGSGVDTVYFDAPPPAQPKIPGEIRYLMVCRLLREKGVFEYLRAAREIKKTSPNAEFVLVGKEDPGSSSSVSQAELEPFRGVVDILGGVDDIKPYLGEADVVVLPSYYREGVPRCLLEAAAMSRPLITTDWIGCRETVINQETGILVPPRDVRALIDAMQVFIDTPRHLKRMGAAGRHFMLENFAETLVIERTQEVYLNAMQN